MLLSSLEIFGAPHVTQLILGPFLNDVMLTWTFLGPPCPISRPYALVSHFVLPPPPLCVTPFILMVEYDRNLLVFVVIFILFSIFGQIHPYFSQVRRLMLVGEKFWSCSNINIRRNKIFFGQILTNCRSYWFGHVNLPPADVIIISFRIDLTHCNNLYFWVIYFCISKVQTIQVHDLFQDLWNKLLGFFRELKKLPKNWCHHISFKKWF